MLAPHILLNLLFYTLQDHLPRGGMTHRELDSPMSIINQEKTPHRLALRQSDGHIFSIDVPLHR